MCSGLGIGDAIIQPSGLVNFWRNVNLSESAAWCGFARSERLSEWLDEGWEVVDIPAERFAETSNFTRKKIWDIIPQGQVVKAIVGKGKKHGQLKVITRPSSPDVFAKFQHERMPVIEEPKFSSKALPAIGKKSNNGDLF